MNRSLRQGITALVGVLSSHFAERRVTASATVTGVQTDPHSGQVTGATVRIGAGEEETIALSYGAMVHAGDVWEVSGGRDPAARRWSLERRIYSIAASEGANLARPMPTLTLFASYGRQASPTGAGTAYGPDKADQAIRYYSIRRGQYDVLAATAYKVRYRYRPVGIDNWTEGPLLFSSPAIAFADGHPRTTLAASIGAGDTSMSVVHSERFPVCASDERVRALVGNELVEGRYTYAGGPNATISSLTRGLEASADDPTTAAGSHTTGQQVTLCTVDAVVEDLSPGTPFEAQIAAVDVYGVSGPWSESVIFTSWRQLAPPPAPVAVTVEAVPGGFEVRWGRPQIVDLKGYIVRRWNSEDWASATKLIVPQTGEEEIVENNWVHWPSTRGVPQGAIDNGTSYLYAHFGVKTVRSSGVESATATWGADQAAPPSPDPANVSVKSLQASVLVTIKPTDAARLDRGWREFVLFSASSTAGADEREEARTSGLDFNLPIDPASGRYFQVVSADWNNNVGARAHTAAYWKRDALGLPAPAGLSVTPTQGGWRLLWDPVVATADPTDPGRVRGYRVYRHTVDLGTSVGGTFLGREVTGTEAIYPAASGEGDYFGVAAVSHAGVIGLARWAIDPVAAPVPPLAAYRATEVPEGFEISVDPAVETAWQDPAFRGYDVITEGGEPEEIQSLGEFTGTRFTYLRPGDSPTFGFRVQLRSILWSGRRSAVQTPWNDTTSRRTRIGRALGSPPNGAFSRLNEYGEPLFWQDELLAGSGALVYDTSSGINGGNCVKWTPPSGTPGAPIGYDLTHVIALPFNRTRRLAVAVYYASSLAYDGPGMLSSFARFRFYSDELGATYVSSYDANLTIWPPERDALEWARGMTVIAPASIPATARSVSIGIHPRIAETVPGGFIFYLDDVQVFQDDG
ncbi:MAG: hypothetical protein U0556_09830 [Dehalococcoidia bacterium]